ncbi:hypothetical protein ABH941_008161 [Streptacidiphilus sp. EB103A]
MTEENACGTGTDRYQRCPIGSGSMGEPERGDLAPRVSVSFWVDGDI